MRRIGRFVTEGNRQSGRRLGGARGVAPASDSLNELQHMAGKAPAWEDEGAERRAKRRLPGDAKHDGFTSLRRDREGAERPVPKGERKAEVPVEMGGIGGVMELVVGRDSAGSGRRRR